MIINAEFQEIEQTLGANFGVLTRGEKGDKGDDYILTEEDKVEIADIVTQSQIVGDIETAIDNIIAIQNELIGGESV